MGKYDGYLGVEFYPGAHLADLFDLEARNPDGSGNNLANPTWGVAHGHFIRVTENSYPDGLGTLWDLPVENSGSQGIPPNALTGQVGVLPQPREITERIMAQAPDVDLPSSAGINEYFQFFGQFLTHDVAESELAIGAGPPLFLDGLPFPFARTPFVDLGDGVRQQKNDESSYLDLSTVYGSSQAIEDLVRANTTEGGAPVKSARLLAGASDNLLPTFQEVADHNGLTFAEVQAVLDPLALGLQPTDFAAGDNRINQQTHLITHHMVWMRNHNWHVEHLEEVYPGWSQEELFQAARALNEADWQNVVYNEYMAKLVGEDAIAAYDGYKPNVDASIINEWTTVAFRFGHDETSNDLGAQAENGAVTQTLTLGEAFAIGPDGVRTDEALNQWVRGQLARYTQEIDGKVVDGNRNLLFGIGGTVDLEVFDIQRGRDHGVGRYNKLRDGLGFDEYASFEDFAADNDVDAATLAALKDIYDDDIDALDSIVGGLLEGKADGSLLGETFTLLNVMQFENLRDGDRHFYLNRFADNPKLLEMIENTSLSDILARTTGIDHIYRDGFAAHERIGGNDGSNRLNGTAEADLLIGFKGHDKLWGKNGDDDLHGDAGDDSASGGSGQDMAYGGAGADKLSGDAGDDFVDGGEGGDSSYGGAGNDFVFGGGGNDKAYGGSGRDHVDGGKGHDRLWGGSGPDTFVFGPNAGKDVIQDFGRNDKLDLSDLGFATLQDVRDATQKSRGVTTIELDDYGSQVKLAGVSWTLKDANLILSDDVFA